MKAARIKWVEKMKFTADTPSEHKLALDAAPEVGGENSGVRPGELTLVALGGCTSMDVVSILRKMRVEFDSFETIVEAEAAETHPKVWTKLHVRYIFTGKNIDETKVERAIELSSEKYCAVSAMLGKTAEMSHEYEIKTE
jgi:putative redox protein